LSDDAGDDQRREADCLQDPAHDVLFIHAGNLARFASKRLRIEE
jgi:hypothetical protein